MSIGNKISNIGVTFYSKVKDPRNIIMNLLIVQILSLYLYTITTLFLQITGKYSFHVALLSICVSCFNVSFQTWHLDCCLTVEGQA